ncbi:hypothetical protein ASE39_24350 [Acidovorax sp. Root267]|uniref:hypothetical protein n=1 Tax=unclassified Acidovorax TaxID=2684926 RepID=UPI00070F81D5|nr:MULTISPECIES: hypothetical protein [unclassified Acidovorax]KRD23874.1 hypothetical protein ASE39_24350 [Acidovorax sp. Root267]MBD9390766.1 hypothetical protein [Acidovorax sp. ACV01]
MPMELLFVLAQSKLPMMIEKPCDVDKLRVLAAAQLVEARLPNVDAPAQKAEVFAISPQGRAALATTYPRHQFRFAAVQPPQGPLIPDWLPSLDVCHMQRDTTRTTLDS